RSAEAQGSGIRLPKAEYVSQVMNPQDRTQGRPNGRRHLSGSIMSVGASRGAALVIIALNSVVIARMLGPSGIGTFAVANALLFVFTVLFELGLPQALAYFVGRGEWSGRPLAREIVGAAFLISVPGAAVTLGSFPAGQLGTGHDMDDGNRVDSRPAFF